MLIDLGRNDVGRVSAPATVRVDERMVVERYSHVMHLVSNVSGTLAEGKDAVDVVRAAFPAGTLSGAPEDPGHADHRGARAGPARASTAARSGTCRIRATPTWPSPSAPWSPAATPSTCRRAPASSPTASPSCEHEECVNKARAVIQAVEMARRSRQARRREQRG